MGRITLSATSVRKNGSEIVNKDDIDKLEQSIKEWATGTFQQKNGV